MIKASQSSSLFVFFFSLSLSRHTCSSKEGILFFQESHRSFPLFEIFFVSEHPPPTLTQCGQCGFQFLGQRNIVNGWFTVRCVIYIYIYIYIYIFISSSIYPCSLPIYSQQSVNRKLIICCMLIFFFYPRLKKKKKKIIIIACENCYLLYVVPPYSFFTLE